MPPRRNAGAELYPKNHSLNMGRQQLHGLPFEIGEGELELYPAEHETILYEASPYPMCEPIVQRLPLRDVGAAEVSPVVTMVLPPRDEPEFDQEMLERVRLRLS